MVTNVHKFCLEQETLRCFFTRKPFDPNRNSNRSGVSFRLYLFSPGNACVESGFSVNADMLVENLNEKSLIVQCRVYHSIVACGGVLNINITGRMLTYAGESHSRKQEWLKQKREKPAK